MSFLIRIKDRIAAFLSNWQEFVTWLPLLIVATLVLYVVLGAFTAVGGDALAWLLELPVMATYAVVACAFAWLFVRTYLHDISAEEESRLHKQAEAGHEGARWVLIKNRLEYLVCLAIFAAFFWPAR
jgi:membrane protein implicated in regulation of membrane protease activity